MKPTCTLSLAPRIFEADKAAVVEIRKSRRVEGMGIYYHHAPKLPRLDLPERKGLHLGAIRVVSQVVRQPELNQQEGRLGGLDLNQRPFGYEPSKLMAIVYLHHEADPLVTLLKRTPRVERLGILNHFDKVVCALFPER